MTLTPTQRKTPLQRRMSALFILMGAFMLMYLSISTKGILSDIAKDSDIMFMQSSYMVFAAIAAIISVFCFFSARNQDDDGYISIRKFEDFHTVRFNTWSNTYPELLTFKQACISKNGYLCLIDYKIALDYVSKDVKQRMHDEFLAPLDLNFEHLNLKEQ